MSPKKNNKLELTKRKSQNHFPVVAIGASVGGLDAVTALLKKLPAGTGMAYIYVQHLNRDHKSLLTDILSKVTKMKVQEIHDMDLLEPDKIFIIPNKNEIAVVNGHIKLLPRPKKETANLSIDVLFSSLAETHRENVIGIILSGNANDGTIGLKAIKDAGGITFAQDSSAGSGSMPDSAIESGAVDYILSPEEIAIALTSISKNELIPYQKVKRNNSQSIDDTYLKKIIESIHKAKGVDFSHYKNATIKRRLNHRMNHRGVKTFREYVKILNEENDEYDFLYNDLLINVTNFFRDKEIFQYLKNHLFPKILKSKSSEDPLRIWIPGCSSGEEAYSIAMLLTELQDKKSDKVPVQIFATDLSEKVIRDARIGEYPAEEMEMISKERVKRFFTKSGENYKVIKELREMCIFAPHNILSDPPFFRIDFISCRNLFIYFDAEAQKRALTSIHFALKDQGYLMLGKSETTATSTNIFAQVNAKFKIYLRKKDSDIRKLPLLLPGLLKSKNPVNNVVSVASKIVDNSNELEKVIDRFLLTRYMPACAIINLEMQIIQFRGSTSTFLTHQSGKASLNILKMMRPEFAFELRAAIHNVIKTKKSVRKSDIELNPKVLSSENGTMTIEVTPLNVKWDEPLFIVVFSIEPGGNTHENTIGVSKKGSDQKDYKIKKLTADLNSLRSEMNLLLESQEAAYEELQVANEEIVSTNEEFQTLNEELETSKEEIEATNEELISTNHELKMHNDLLTESYNYSETIIATIHEPMVILDCDFHVKSANKSFYKMFYVTMEETEGTSFFEMGNKLWDIPQLKDKLSDMLNTNSDFQNFELTHSFKNIGEKIMLLNANRIVQKVHREKLILLAIEDITERSVKQQKEKEFLKRDIVKYQENKLELEKTVKKRTRQLEKKNLELERVNKDLTTFSYVSSHDLQEPLRKIRNFVTVLLESEVKNISPRGKEYFMRMSDTAKRMQTLIEDLLTYSRAKNADNKFEKTNLSDIVDEVKRNFEDTIVQKKAKIKVINQCQINIIPFQFRQLFQNLIGNSLKFSKPDEAPLITIKCSIKTGSELNVKGLSEKKKYSHIVLNDNGIGFMPEYKDRIFEVFQRLHSPEQYDGTGIGLAICKRIVENHQGLILASGQLKQGARFDIYIPA